MPVLATRAIRAKPHVIHAALRRQVLGDVLVGAVLLAAVAERAEEVADGHALEVVLVEEVAGVALHAQAPQPVPAHGLPNGAAAAALPTVRPGRGGAGGVGRRQGGGSGTGSGGGGGGGVGVQEFLEVEDEVAVVAVHFVG